MTKPFTRVAAIMLCLGLIIASTLLIPHPAVQAQPSIASISYAPVFAPASSNVTATCAGAACPTFVLGGNMCTATVRLSGTNSALSVVAQASNDQGANYSPLVPTIPGTGLTAPNGTIVATTGAMTQGGTGTPGLYVLQVPTYNRLRFIVGTLTGTNVLITVRATGLCNGQAM